VNNCIQTLRYIEKHPNRFESITVPIFISYLKISVEVNVEVTCMAMTATWDMA